MKRIKAVILATAMVMGFAFEATAEPGQIVIGAAPGEAVTVAQQTQEAEDGFKESIYLTDLGLTPAQQRRFWEHAKAHGADAAQTRKIYIFYVATAWSESNFRSRATHKNNNGSTDGGIMQVNSCNVKKLVKAGVIESSRDLHDQLKGIDAGCYLADECIRKYGVTENAYFHYNAGLNAKGKSNANSRRMWQEFQDFCKVLE